MAGTAVGEGTALGERSADFVAATALCEPRSADFVAGTALSEPRSADFVAGTAPERPAKVSFFQSICNFLGGGIV